MLILLAVEVTGLIMGSWQNEFTNPQPPKKFICWGWGGLRARVRILTDFSRRNCVRRHSLVGRLTRCIRLLK